MEDERRVIDKRKEQMIYKVGGRVVVIREFALSKRRCVLGVFSWGASNGVC